MGIDTYLEDEDGESIQIVGDPKSILSHASLNGSMESGVICLKYLDPYGDATFNHLQMPHLVEELRNLSNTSRDKELQEHIEKILKLIEKGRKDLHTYIKFYGD